MALEVSVAVAEEDLVAMVLVEASQEEAQAVDSQVAEVPVVALVVADLSKEVSPPLDSYSVTTVSAGRIAWNLKSFSVM